MKQERVIKFKKVKKEMMMMHITIQVSSDVARILHQQRSPTAASDEIFKVAEELNLVLKPVHAGTKNHHLATYFTVEVPNPATAELVKTRLQLCKGIEAAYLKPPDEMP